MPAIQQDRVKVACPHCGHQQLEPRTGISTVCKKCHGHYRVQEAINPVKKVAEAAPEKRRLTCFECGAELEAPLTAQSTMCKRCSRYIDLKDYAIANAVSKNFKTKGSFTIEPTGYVFNTEIMAHDAIIKGRFLGKLTAWGSLTIYSTAEIRGTFKTKALIIPATNHFRWKDTIEVRSAEIAGELAADMQVAETMVLKATARFFGDIEAKNLVVEEGAVVVGKLRLGGKGGGKAVQAGLI
jgi:cytoskeletal protein CcmA (bactofilin family)/DNA-directed RNA polymerase subunit RPC12/RpoP